LRRSSFILEWPLASFRREVITKVFWKECCLSYFRSPSYPSGRVDLAAAGVATSEGTGSSTYASAELGGCDVRRRRHIRYDISRELDQSFLVNMEIAEPGKRF
jgi:hypothetical protein